METSARSIGSFHGDPFYEGDPHRADMAWVLHAARHGLSQGQIENEILHGRDLSKKGPPLRRLAYAMRTASKAIAQSVQWSDSGRRGARKAAEASKGLATASGVIIRSARIGPSATAIKF